MKDEKIKLKVLPEIGIEKPGKPIIPAIPSANKHTYKHYFHPQFIMQGKQFSPSDLKKIK